MVKRDLKFGNDVFKNLILEDDGNDFELMYWDLWIVILLHNLFDNNWENLINAIIKNSSTSNRYSCESMVSHIKYFREKLSQNNVNCRDIILSVDEITIKKQLIKANKKVMKLEFQSKEKSLWMQKTPRVVLFESAMKGNPNALPVGTGKYLGKFRSKFKTKTHYNKNQAYNLSEKLSEYIKKNEPVKIANKSAFYRAFLTVIIEEMSNIDDSFGQIGMLASDVFKNYLAISWRELNVDFREYFDDLIKLIIWEDYGTFDGLYLSIFSRLTKDELYEVSLIIKNEYEILKTSDLDYPAKKALVLMGLCNIDHPP